MAETAAAAALFFASRSLARPATAIVKARRILRRSPAMHRILAAVAILIIPNWGRCPEGARGQAAHGVHRPGRGSAQRPQQPHRDDPQPRGHPDPQRGQRLAGFPGGCGRFRRGVAGARPAGASGRRPLPPRHHHPSCLEADKLRRSEAHADFDLVLVNQATGAPVYQDKALADTMTGSIIEHRRGHLRQFRRHEAAGAAKPWRRRRTRR